MVNIVITAPRGHMDGLIVKAACERDDIRIVGGLGPAGRDYIGKDIGLAAGLGREIGALVYDDLTEIIDRCDLVVDFSRVELSMEVLSVCKKYKKGFLCGTTGFSAEQEKALLAAGKEIPMMKAANTSYVVNVMRKLLGIAAEALGDKAKIEIIDLHSQNKLDAPSGTALELGEEITARSDKKMEDIAFHSVRAGDTPSSHKVIFGCMGEMMEISHHAYNWECYARGACDAMVYMAEHGPGLYTMEDVIGL
ncbi:4-hydroxy-tetrahydrodipicolinate reductase [Anaerovorax odorimutans]|uniref:4-hydroxy-tetrahydrodipicolinate reductase n=1 Tax=Anaerovorax odorimutans TaxID=109327 RepID=A0ABT1RPE4_9FIRM|nr:4-hydroxy-tetrahydrodipicolinate reductase [Anaerovorax odorimutans]MCQ4637069.1 4-hydroxy-tetrahydrodipicolinate reductase [Anaerovorax odorimutans]